MERITHTPGPWTIDLHWPNNCAVYILHDTQGGESEMEAEANARLIAAAPEILELLKDAEVNIRTLHGEFHSEEEFYVYCQWLRAARAAIAIATGK